MNPPILYRCPKCGKFAVVDTSIALTSYPPQYSYYYDNCKESGYVCCDAVNIYFPFKGVIYSPDKEEGNYERNE